MAGDLTPQPWWIRIWGWYEPSAIDYRQTFPDVPSALNYAEGMTGLESYAVMLGEPKPDSTDTAKKNRKHRKPVKKWSALAPATKARWRKVGVGPNTYNAGGWTEEQARAARRVTNTPERPADAIRNPARFGGYIIRHRDALEVLFAGQDLDELIRAATKDMVVHLYVDTSRQR